LRAGFLARPRDLGSTVAVANSTSSSTFTVVSGCLDSRLRLREVVTASSISVVTGDPFVASWGGRVFTPEADWERADRVTRLVEAIAAPSELVKNRDVSRGIREARIELRDRGGGSDGANTVYPDKYLR
jgi:hypothetical protein